MMANTRASLARLTTNIDLFIKASTRITIRLFEADFHYVGQVNASIYGDIGRASAN